MAEKKRAMQILDAAEQLLGESGYAGVSASAIAARAGVNKALVFYYWGSKEELLGRVLERYYDRHREALEAGPDEGTLRERLHQLVDSYLDFVENNRLYARFIQQQVSGGGPHLALVQRHLRRFFSWTNKLLEEVAPADGPLAARHFYVTLTGVVVSYFTYAPALGSTWGRDPTSASSLAERREHVHWVIEQLLKGLDSEASK